MVIVGGGGDLVLEEGIAMDVIERESTGGR